MWKSNFIFRQRHSQLFPSYSQDTARRDFKINCLWMVEFVQVLFKINWPQKVKKKKTVTRYWWTLSLAKFVGQIDERNVRASCSKWILAGRRWDNCLKANDVGGANWGKIKFRFRKFCFLIIRQILDARGSTRNYEWAGLVFKLNSSLRVDRFSLKFVI